MKKYNTSYRLNQVISERNLKQVDILRLAEPYCKKYGIKLNKNDLSQYVSGKVEPGQHKLFILALALNVNEAWLMGFDDIPMDHVSKPTEEHQESKLTDDIELQEYLEELKNREEMRMLFSLTKNATKEDVMQAVKIIEALKKDD